MKGEKLLKLFAKYEKQLKTIFEFYTKLEDIEINDKSEANKTNMPYRSFVKFANQMKLVPTIITSEEIVMLFKLKTKSKSENLLTFTYEDFLESLVKVTIRGNEKIKKITEEAKTVKTSAKHFFDVKGITVEMIENLLKYIDISPTEKKSVLTNRLHELQNEGKKGALKQKKTVSITKHSIIYFSDDL